MVKKSVSHVVSKVTPEFTVIIEFRKHNIKWFSRYQKHFKNIPVKFSRLSQYLDSVEANKEFRRHPSSSYNGAAQKRGFRKKLMPGVSYDPTTTTDRPTRHREANNHYQAQEYYTKYDCDDYGDQSSAAATLGSLQTNPLNQRFLLKADPQLTSNMLKPSIEASFACQCSGNFPSKDWPSQAHRTAR